MRSMCKVTLVLLFLALALAGQVHAQPLTPTDIGDLGGGAATTFGVAPGYVVGSSPTPSSVDGWGNQVGHAFVWSASTGMQDIAASFPNAGYSKAISVNSHGEVAGLYYALDYSSATGFFWSQATGVVTIGPVSGVNGGSMVMNESGVVGSVTPDGRAFRWTQTGGVQDLGTSDFSDLSVSGINSRGDIVGKYWSANGYIGGFIAWAGGTRTNLHSPSPDWPYNPPPQAEVHQGEVNLQINGINDSGVVVGQYWDFKYITYGYDIHLGGFFSLQVHNSHAFKWSSTEGFTDLGNLGSVIPSPGKAPMFGATANAINNAGMIVGSSNLTTGGYAPFSYTNNTMTQLPGLYPGDNQATATGVNGDGVATGWANGQGAAVMWVNGVLTTLVPRDTLQLQWPGAAMIRGSMIGGSGVNNNWVGRAWAMSLPSSAPADTTPPVITVPGNQTVEATGPSGAVVTFAAAATDDVDGPLNAVCTPSSGSTFALGTTTVTCSATDAAQNTGSVSFTVTVRDTTAPVFTAGPTSSSVTLWPPNHQMVPITVTAEAFDAVGASVAIFSVTSNEPGNGLGDGDTANDIEITGALKVNLRAERSGMGNGRIYTITVVARDAAGNATTRTTTVSVPKSQRR